MDSFISRYGSRSGCWCIPAEPDGSGLQALNNWGLVLQELATMQAPAEQTVLVQQSMKRFRQVRCQG